jgi:hypothetical protein
VSYVVLRAIQQRMTRGAYLPVSIEGRR